VIGFVIVLCIIYKQKNQAINNFGLRIKARCVKKNLVD